MARRTPLALTAAAALMLVLAGCATGGAGPSPSATSSEPGTPTATATPTPTPEPPQASFPADCGAIGTPASRATTVDQLNLQGDGTGFVRPAPPGATLVLGCDWFAGDASGILVLISQVDPAAAETYAATLPSLGYTCAVEPTGVTVCTMTTPNSQYPVDTVETIGWRDNAWVYTSVTNVDATALLQDLQSSVWPS
jgi:hypothetical protein